MWNTRTTCIVTHTQTYTHTGYSDGTSVGSATGSVARGGECLVGLKLAVKVVNNTGTNLIALRHLCQHACNYTSNHNVITTAL